jgi:hypothetical protein
LVFKRFDHTDQQNRKTNLAAKNWEYVLTNQQQWAEGSLPTFKPFQKLRDKPTSREKVH